jgi:hypothetical protein
MRLADGTWFGGSRMFGPGKIASCSAKLVDRGPVFARVGFRYTYADGNTLDLTVQVAAGDNALRMEIGDQNISPVRRPEGDSIGCYNSPVSGPLFQDTGRLAVLGVV